jgi:molecular chaperone DnaK
MIHGTEKSIKDLGDKVEAGEKAAAESAIAELKTALEGNDKDAIEAKTQALTEAAGKIAEKAYAEQAQEGAAQPGAEQAEGAAADDDVVDAEFEEVKEGKEDK